MSKRFTAEELAKLREIAEAAVQGDWYICHPNCRQVWVRDDGPLGGWCVAICDTQESGEGFTPEAMDANARHIATFDPPTVLALLDEIERLQREREVLAAAVRAWDDYAKTIIENGPLAFDAIDAMERAEQRHREALALLEGGGGA